MFVHCVQGRSRSATMVLAYLMKYRGMSLNDSFKFVKEKRPIICPNATFFAKLIELEKSWLGKQSIKLSDVFCKC